jgi:tetratricopeptide (TPR) repeat protein
MLNVRQIVNRPIFICLAALLIAGCEGWDRKHDSRVTDVSPPPEDAAPVSPGEAKTVSNFADMVEDLVATRQALVQKTMDLERAYLQAGDSTHADWARRQRALFEGVLIYPYLSQEAPEHRVDAAPEQSIPEADTIFNQAKAILNDVRSVPLMGALTHNKNKAREALAMFKKILEQYSKSDKVDDAAYYCAEIYKEYLREDDPNDELSVRYYRWAVQLDPQTPHAARFQCAVVYDFRRHERAKALELYQQVLDTEENKNQSNMRFSATRIEQLSDEEFSHLKPTPGSKRPEPPEPKSSSDVKETPAEPLSAPPGSDDGSAMEPEKTP